MVVITLGFPMDARMLALQRLAIIPTARQILTPMLEVVVEQLSVQIRLQMSAVVR